MHDPLAETLDLGLYAGALLLRNGAETWRIEDTVQRMMLGLGARECDVVATATSIFASVSDGHESRTRVRRVRGVALNLATVDAVNALSRRAAQDGMAADELRAELARIDGGAPLYAAPTMLAAGLLTAAGFALLFGGGSRELLATLPGAGALTLVQIALGRTPLPGLATTAIASLVGVLCSALLLEHLYDVRNPSVVFLSTVVFLVPGAAIVTAIGDLFGGHLLSGLARGAAAGLVAAAIAAGVALGLRLTGTPL